MSAKLLIVEEEPALRNHLLQHLKREGYVCEWAASYGEAWRKTVHHEYDGIVLDVTLSGGDGLQLVELLRREHPGVGIILLSTRDALEDRISGLDRGADDYLVKPVHPAELHARLKALLRRQTGGGSRQLRFEALLIDLEERSVLAGGRLLNLTKKEFDILVYLARNRNRVVAKDRLAEHLWGDHMEEAPSFDFIYAHIKNLRKKLTDTGCANYLKTVYGIGYKFCVE